MWFVSIFIKFTSFISVITPLLVAAGFIFWFLSDFRINIVDKVISYISGFIGDLQVDIDFSGLGLILSKVDMFFPVNLFFDRVSFFVEVAISVIVAKWIRNLIPGFS